MKRIHRNIIISLLAVTALSGCGETGGLLVSKPGSTVSTPVSSAYQPVSSKTLERFISKKNPWLAEDKKAQYAAFIDIYSQRYNLDPKIVASLIARESSFKADAVSSAGAKGLGQLMDGTAKDMGVTNSFDPVQNIKGTTKYLNWLMNRTNKDLSKTLASYNMGPGAVERTLKAGKTIPSPVQNYVSDILKMKSTI